MIKIEYINRKTGELERERPPGEKFLKFLYHNPFGKIPLNLFVKKKFLSSIYGKMMKNPRSRKKIKPFIEQYKIDMDEYIKSADEFSSFNDFFCRKLKPSARKMQDGIISPADGKILAFESINEINEFFIKGRRFTLQEYLQNNKLAQQYKNSSLFIIRLSPNDYHRFHFPYDGRVSETYKIKGKYLSVSPYAVIKNFTKIFCENKREYCILSTDKKGKILISPIGATMVGSIIETYKPRTDIKKGDEMGYFAFGGSTLLMLIDKNNVKIDDDILDNTKKGLETSITMGDKIAE